MKYLLAGESTARLKFRHVKDQDFTPWMSLFEAENAARFVGLGHLETPEECCKAWFEKGKARYSNDLGGMNALVEKTSNSLIGQAGLLIQEVDGSTVMEIGYSMLPQYWNKGYATEAAIKCRDFAFGQNYAEELISIIHTENEGSMKVARNNGMKLWKNTEYKGTAVHIFRITKKEWVALDRK